MLRANASRNSKHLRKSDGHCRGGLRTENEAKGEGVLCDVKEEEES
jgi:hypothetical protein